MRAYGTGLACICFMSPESGGAVTGIARKNLSVCVLDDDPDHVEITSHRLVKAGFIASGTTDPEEALQQVRLGTCRVVLADLKMPKMDGMAFLDQALRLDPGIYVILLTGFYSVESAIAAVKLGAYDYLCKPLDFLRLEKSLDEIAENFARRSEIQHLEERLFQSLHYKGIVGNSPAMIRSEEHTSELQSPVHLVCRLLLEKKKK